MASTAKAAKPFIGAVEDEWQMYSDNASDYSIGPHIGFGASSIVYAATYHPSSGDRLPCAVKVLDLDVLPPRSLNLLERETQLMSLSKHPNVLRVRGSWMNGHKLCIAMRLMNAGSAADIMRYGWPGGMEEDVVTCILKQALEGLNYLHINGFIHRDIKAANLLIDDDGTVLLGDLGVAADLTDHDNTAHSKENHHRRMVSFEPTVVATAHVRSAHAPSHAHPGVERPRIGKRKSFVGTPCWMAPEVIRGKQYDSSADIWSFGITAIELAHGRAPRSRESSHKALLQTVQDAPPAFKRDEGQHKYSRAFQEMVETCLNKEPGARPMASQLLQLPLFKNAKKKSSLVHTILRGLPALAARQERRAVPSVYTRNSVDSWDFPASPGNSVFGRRPKSFGDDAHAHHGRSRSNSHLANTSRSSSRVSLHGYRSRPHSRSVSVHEDLDKLGDGDPNGVELAEEPIGEFDTESNTPPETPLVHAVPDEPVSSVAPLEEKERPAPSSPIPVPLSAAATGDLASSAPDGGGIGRSSPASMPRLSSSASTASVSSLSTPSPASLPTSKWKRFALGNAEDDSKKKGLRGGIVGQLVRRAGGASGAVKSAMGTKIGRS